MALAYSAKTAEELIVGLGWESELYPDELRACSTSELRRCLVILGTPDADERTAMLSRYAEAEIGKVLSERGET